MSSYKEDARELFQFTASVLEQLMENDVESTSLQRARLENKFRSDYKDYLTNVNNLEHDNIDNVSEKFLEENVLDITKTIRFCNLLSVKSTQCEVGLISHSQWLGSMNTSRGYWDPFLTHPVKPVVQSDAHNCDSRKQNVIESQSSRKSRKHNRRTTKKNSAASDKLNKLKYLPNVEQIKNVLPPLPPTLKRKKRSLDNNNSLNNKPEEFDMGNENIKIESNDNTTTKKRKIDHNASSKDDKKKLQKSSVQKEELINNISQNIQTSSILLGGMSSQDDKTVMEQFNLNSNDPPIVPDDFFNKNFGNSHDTQEKASDSIKQETRIEEIPNSDNEDDTYDPLFKENGIAKIHSREIIKREDEKEEKITKPRNLNASAGFKANTTGNDQKADFSTVLNTKIDTLKKTSGNTASDKPSIPKNVNASKVNPFIFKEQTKISANKNQTTDNKKAGTNNISYTPMGPSSSTRRFDNNHNNAQTQENTHIYKNQDNNTFIQRDSKFYGNKEFMDHNNSNNFSNSNNFNRVPIDTNNSTYHGFVNNNRGSGINYQNNRNNFDFNASPYNNNTNTHNSFHGSNRFSNSITNNTFRYDTNAFHDRYQAPWQSNTPNNKSFHLNSTANQFPLPNSFDKINQTYAANQWAQPHMPYQNENRFRNQSQNSYVSNQDDNYDPMGEISIARNNKGTDIRTNTDTRKNTVKQKIPKALRKMHDLVDKYNLED